MGIDLGLIQRYIVLYSSNSPLSLRSVRVSANTFRARDLPVESRLFVYLFVCMFVCLYVCMFTCKFVCLLVTVEARKPGRSPNHHLTYTLVFFHV